MYMMSYDFFSSFLPSHSLTDSINFIDLLNYFMKQTGFVASRGRSALSDAQISDEHVAQVNYQFSVLYITPFVSSVQNNNNNNIYQNFHVKQSLLLQKF